MFNWLFRKTQTDDSYKLDILSPEADLAHLYAKLAVFYHYVLYSKLVDILACIYGGYNGEVSKFQPPSDYLEDLYIRILDAFKKLDKRPELNELKIVVFKAYPTLLGNHHEQIKLYENLLKDYSEDKEMLKNRVQQYPLSNDVQVVFNDIDKLIEMHNRLKSEALHGTGLLKYSEMSLNLNAGTLQFKENKPVKIIPSNQEIKLLQLLFAHKNTIVSYSEIAKDLNMNSYHGEINEEVLGAIKIIKNKLNVLLNKAGFRRNVVNNVRNSGYILDSMKLT